MAQFSVKWTLQSEQDLDKLRETIANNFTVDLAIELVDELVDKVEALLTNNPLSGILLETNPLFSKIVYKGNVIYYCENPKDRSIYFVYVQSQKTAFKENRIRFDI